MMVPMNKLITPSEEGEEHKKMPDAWLSANLNMLDVNSVIIRRTL